MQAFEEKLARYKSLISQRLAQAVEKNVPASLYEPMRYTMQAGGKRLRPLLLLLSVEALGGDVQAALPAAAAVELLHNFTLVHDDIMDNDDTRRGRPTVHQKWDTSVALLAGDGLVSLAYRSLFECPSPRILEIARLFTDALIEVCEGQALDAEYETRHDVSMDEYLEMIGKKTARLLSLCSQLGALIAEAPPEAVQAMRVYGQSMGLAFQIQDDLLDITSDQKTLGKDFGSDIRQKKKTFLLVHAQHHADAQQRAELERILARDVINREDVLQIRRLFESIGTLQEAQAAVKRYLQEAEAALEPLNRLHARTDDLKRLLQRLVNRRA